MELLPKAGTWTLCLLFVAASASNVPTLQKPDGSVLKTMTHRDCYPKFYDLRCPIDSKIAAIAYEFGMKAPDFQKDNNCSRIFPIPYPEQCCQVNETADCIFQDSKDFEKLLKNCAGKSSCPSMRTPWVSMTMTSPVNCRYIDRSDRNLILTTQYATTYYACVPDVDIQPVCSSAVHFGKSLHIASNTYTAPGAHTPSRSFDCTCKVKVTGSFSSDQSISVKAIDLRLCDGSSSSCNQSASFLVGGHVAQRVGPSKGPKWMSLREVFSTNSPDLDFRLGIVDTDPKYHLWLYVDAQGADLSVTCRQTFAGDSPIFFTAPTPKSEAMTTAMKRMTTTAPNVVPTAVPPIGGQRSSTPALPAAIATPSSSPPFTWHPGFVPTLQKPDGSVLKTMTHRDCYPKYYDLRCPIDSKIAAIAYEFGMKAPDFQKDNNCSRIFPTPYPEQCCQVNETADCIFQDSKDFEQLLKNCAGKSSCPSMRTPWVSMTMTSPVNCRYIDRSDRNLILTTQYATTYYACVPDVDIQPVCSSAVHFGKSLHIASNTYTAPGAHTPSRSFDCTCKIKVTGSFSSDQSISVKAIDLRLCDGSSSSCNQSASFLVGGHVAQRVGPSNEPKWMSLKEVFSTNSPDLDFRLGIVDTDPKYHLWLYVDAQGADLSVTCRQTFAGDSPIFFTAPTPKSEAMTTAMKRMTMTAPNVVPTAVPPIGGQRSSTPALPAAISTPSSSPSSTWHPGFGTAFAKTTTQPESGGTSTLTYVAIGGGVAGSLVLVVICACLWVKCKRRRLEKKIQRKSLTNNSVSQWMVKASENMDSRQMSDVDSAIEMASVVSGVTTLSPLDSVSQVALHRYDQCRRNESGAYNERNQLLSLLKQRIREKPELEEQILNIPESLYERRSLKVTTGPKNIDEVLERFSTETLIQTLYEFNRE